MHLHSAENEALFDSDSFHMRLAAIAGAINNAGTKSGAGLRLISHDGAGLCQSWPNCGGILEARCAVHKA